jgi:UDP-N-acetylmuramoyl-L-alanyl-D-glutamate--2,6-diaminopimelate ligase
MAAALKETAMRLGDLLGPAAGAHAQLPVRDLVLDSRQAGHGAAFVAVAGSRTHGLAFAGDALARGASIVLYEPSAAYPRPPEPSLAVEGLGGRLGEFARAFFGQPASRIAGITGTNGKTTVACVLAQALTRLDPACGYIGTLGFGVPPALREHALTTPDCFSLHRELAELAVPRVAMEVSSHALAQDRVAGLDFDCAAFTNLSREHLDQHGDQASYGEAKARLFAREDIRFAVVNLDDAFSETLAERLGAGTVLLGTSLRGAPGAALSARVDDRGLGGLALDVSGRFGAASLASSLIGEFNAENLLVALGVMLGWGLPLAESAAALSACRPPPGRMQIIAAGAREPTVIVDYAHTPDALERALRVLRRVADGRLWCVFGCGGERDPGKRAPMGAAAAKLADRIVLTDDNPRDEDPAAIVAAIRAGIGAHPRVEIEHDRGAAIARAVRGAGARDVVLIAGKGHETWQTVGGAKRPFSDEAAARAALEDRR